MTPRPLHELLHELDSTLRAGAPIPAEDRALLERVQRELALLAALPQPSAAPHNLRENLREALQRLQIDHPQLSALVSRTLDTLSDLGI